MQNSGTAPAESKVTDLFVLSDEQILDIAPESVKSEPVGQPFLAVQERPNGLQSEPVTPGQTSPIGAGASPATGVRPADTARPEMAAPLEPPAWLAAQMKDPWSGPEAREFWDGVQQARSEAAAYRAAIASPEDARALKELYPGGVSEARAAAERARLLDEVDRAYFGAAGNSPEQLSASRAQLAQRMLQQDPAAFREMVETGVKVLQEADTPSRSAKSVASPVSDSSQGASPRGVDASFVVAQHAAPLQGNHPPVAAPVAAGQNEAHVAAYAAFERAANEDLERSVGGAIERTLAQALPASERNYTSAQAGAQRSFAAAPDRTAPLREKLASSVRAEVEKALQGDRQLGEQVAQILSSRRFDNDARAQIVRLIGERAQQLVPTAAKRVLNEWTQTTLAAHRGRTQRADKASGLPDTALASTPAVADGSEQRPTPRRDAATGARHGSATKSQSVNYRKLSDEQILEM